jgi:arabinoxylan arabinofuranohydrolase
MKTFLFTLIVAVFSTFASAADSSAFNGINLAKSYKDIKNHNPINTIKYSADPGVMVYDGRVYVYGTNDGYAGELGRNPQDNTYGQINTINVMSSDDLVNWIDHGTIPAAGRNGAAKWAGNSWAPCATHKKINGKEKFFLYFANSGNGIGVLTSDSPTGPFVDPIGHALISRSTPNCSNIVWLFDPAVFVDDDGTGYLYFGGGVPDNQSSNPKTVRAVKLGNDMTSLAGNPVTIDAPWVFEDSGINKSGDTYFYSYCTNWNGGPYGNAKIAYMTSKNPLGPFTMQGTVLNNPGDFFGTTGNNHHTIIEFKDQWYIFYHAEWLNKQEFGSQKGYRTSHVDVLPFSNGKFGNAKGTLTGVTQLFKVNAYNTNYASMMAWQGGVSTNGLGHTTVTYNRGEWTGVSNVDFGEAATSVKITAASNNGAVIRITTGSPNGDVVGYVSIPATGGNSNFKTVTADINTVSGTKHVFFVASGDVVVDTWQFIGSGTGSDEPIEFGDGELDLNDKAKLEDGWYYIKNPSTGKYIQVEDGVGRNSANVVIGSERKDDAQKWKVTNTNGYVTFTSALGNYMIDIANGEDRNGANVQIYDAYGGDAQQFIIYKTGRENVYTIGTKASAGDKAIDIEGARNGENVNLLQWTNEYKDNQTWSFEKAEDSTPEPEEPACWSEPLGYPCCSSWSYVYYVDDDGNWGVENDDWCGLLTSCDN